MKRTVFGPGTEGVAVARCAESRKLLAELDAQLEAASRRHGRTVSFTPVETANISMICDEIDRKAQLKRLYGRADTVKEKLKISTEIRLLESSINRMLRQVKVEMPAPMNSTSQKAQRAANARWGVGS